MLIARTVLLLSSLFLSSGGHGNPFTRFSPIESTIDIGSDREIDITLSLPYQKVHIEKEKKKPYPLVLFLQGSGCTDASTMHITGHRLFEKYHTGLLTINKFGTRKGFLAILNLFHCPESFHVNNTHSQRVADILAVLQSLKKSLKLWDGRLFLVGGQSGGGVVLELAQTFPGTEAMVLTNFGVGFAESSHFKTLFDCYHSKKCEGLEPEQVELVKRMKLGAKEGLGDRIEWNGIKENAHWWKDTLETDVGVYTQLKHPTLILQGGIDRFLGKDASVSLKERNAAKDFVKLIVFEKYDHQWRELEGKSGLAEVWEKVTDFLGEFLDPNQSPAKD